MRLTHKHKYKADNKRFVFDMKDYRKACQKLGQLEDIEDELGIDLITLFKALKNGIWIRTDDRIVFHKAPYKTLAENIGYFRRLFEKEYTHNYGKTWALTEEEINW
ncbi:MAG: hypothetical protein K5765_06740 [Clostridia bacterium]|nr:hypothetical protein [Clostridia bacterium]